MSPKDADRMANRVDPDQTVPPAIWSGSTLFAQTRLSENNTINQELIDKPNVV